MNFMAELICLTCKATKEGINVKASRFGYPHKPDCRVQDIRLVSTVKTLAAKLTKDDIKAVVNTSDGEDAPVPENTTPLEKPKRKRAAKKTESA